MKYALAIATIIVMVAALCGHGQGAESTSSVSDGFAPCQRIIDVRLKIGEIKPTESPFISSVKPGDQKKCSDHLASVAKSNPKEASDQLCKALIERYKIKSKDKTKAKEKAKKRFDAFFFSKYSDPSGNYLKIAKCPSITDPNTLLKYESSACANF